MDGQSVERLRRADAVFDEALDLPAAERAAYVDATCGDDAALSAAVHRLLRAHDQSTDFLSAPAGSAAPVMDAVLAETAGLPAPLRLGPFRVVRRLGYSGMSAVYEGERDDGQFRQRVALKLVNCGLGTEHLVRHFLRERQILAGLEHPHIARLLDGGFTSDGVPWFAMEFVEGQPIDRYCTEHTLSVDERLRLFLDVCEAVAYAHEMGVIHRDLKPGNILVSHSGAVKLLDFGIARLLDPGGSASDAPITRPTFAPLTPEYAAPEQLRGEPASAANDVYALGVVVYELMVGERPGQQRKKLGGDLDRIVAGMLEPNPQQRYESVAAVGEDLRRLAERRPLLTPPDTAWQRARRFARRDRRRSAAIAAGIAAVVIAGVASSYGWRADDDVIGVSPNASAIGDGERLIVANFRVAGRDSLLGPALGDVFARYLAQSRTISIVPARHVSSALERMRRPPESRLDLKLAQEVAQREGLRAVVAGDLVPLGAGYLMSVRLIAAASGDELTGVQVTASKPDDVLPALERLGRSLRRTLGESLRDVRQGPRLERMTTSSLDALRKYSEGRWGRVGFERQLALYREAIAIDSTFAYAHMSLGNLLGSALQNSAARDSSLTRAYHLRDRLSPMERTAVEAFYWNWVGRDRRRSMAAFSAQIAGDSTDWRAILNLAAYLNATREFAHAESVLRRYEKNVGGHVLWGLARSQIGQGNFAVADSMSAAVLRERPEDLLALLTRLTAAFARIEVDSAAVYASRLNSMKPKPVQMRPMESLVWIARMRGRLSEASRLTVEASSINTAAGTPRNIFPVLIDAVREDLWLRNSPDAAVARLDAILIAHPVGSLVNTDDKVTAVEAVALYAAAGQPRRARALLRTVVPASDSFALRTTSPQREAALGEIALAEGRAHEAMARFRRSDMAGDGLPVSACTVCTLPALARGAELAGLPDSARALWERYVTTTSLDRAETDSWFLAMAYRRLSALHAAAGNRAMAVNYDRNLVLLWRRADEELRSPTTAARRRVAHSQN